MRLCPRQDARKISGVSALGLGPWPKPGSQGPAGPVITKAPGFIRAFFQGIVRNNHSTSRAGHHGADPRFIILSRTNFRIFANHRLERNGREGHGYNGRERSVALYADATQSTAQAPETLTFDLEVKKLDTDT